METAMECNCPVNKVSLVEKKIIDLLKRQFLAESQFISITVQYFQATNRTTEKGAKI